MFPRCLRYSSLLPQPLSQSFTIFYLHVFSVFRVLPPHPPSSSLQIQACWEVFFPSLCRGITIKPAFLVYLKFPDTLLEIIRSCQYLHKPCYCLAFNKLCRANIAQKDLSGQRINQAFGNLSIIKRKKKHALLSSET